MSLTSLLVDDTPVPADLHGLAAVTLVGSHELDAAVAVPVVVPIHKRGHPKAGVLRVTKGPTRVVRSVFRCPEQGFGVGVVVGHPWPGEGSEHAQLLQPALERGRTHGVAVVGLQDQRLLAALADPLADAGPADQIGCNGWVLAFGDVPGHHLAAPDVDHQIEVQPHSTNGGRQVGDIPAPHLVRLGSPQTRYRPWLLWWPCPTAPVGLAMGMQNPIKAALRTDVEPAIRQHRHDLSRWQRRKFGFVAGQQDPLAFFLAEAVSDMAVAAFAAIDAITVTSELAAPALQRGEPHAQQQRQLMGSGTVSNALIQDLQSLLAINRRRQSSPSSR